MMDDKYYFYEKNYTSRDVKIVLKSGNLVVGYLNTIVPADENDEEQMILTINVDGYREVTEVLENDIDTIEVDH